MIACMTEGKLRACLDGELPSDEARSASRHLLSCERCRDEMGRLRTRASRVATLMGFLEPVSPGPQQDGAAALVHIHGRVPEGRGARPIRWAAIGALAVLILLSLMIPKILRRPGLPAVAVGSKAAAPASIASGAGLAEASLPAPEIQTSAQPAQSQARPRVDCYLALDNGEPVQMGFVVRMSLPASILAPWESAQDSRQIQADVVIDEDGRARAIRFLR